MQSFTQVVYVSRCDVGPRPADQDSEFLHRKDEFAQLAVLSFAMAIQHEIYLQGLAVLVSTVVRDTAAQIALAQGAIDGSIATTMLDQRRQVGVRVARGSRRRRNP
jgi:protein-disulfide isomerase-like protein with CxxC motif